MAKEKLLSGFWNRVLQLLARNSPGARTFRVWLNRLRGVKIGKGVWIGYDSLIETSYPHLVTIKDRAAIGIRCVIIAHMREIRGVVIEEDVDIGVGAIILAGVTIGRGSVVAAGSVVTKSVPPMTLVQGNPAQNVAKVGLPLKSNVTMREWLKNLKRIT